MKTTSTKVLIALFALSLLSQCNSKPEGSYAKLIKAGDDEIVVCNINEVTDTIDLPLSEFMDGCEFVPLETNEQSLFESVNHVSISDNYIAVHSVGQHPIKLFDRKGKFIRDIGSIGRGPGEFTSLYGMQLDEEADRVYLTAFAGAEEILVYNLEGEYISSIPLLYSPPKCRIYVEDETVTVLSMPFNDQVPVAYQQTFDGKLIQKLPVIDHLILRPDFSNEVSSSHNAGAYDLFIYAWGQEGFDTLYYYNPEKNRLTPKYVASFVDPKSNAFNYELKNHYYTVAYGEKYNRARIIVDKKTLKSDFFNIKNDFYGNIPIYRFYMSGDGWFITSFHAFELISLTEELLADSEINSNVRKKLQTIQSSLKENDNDILFLGKMK